MPRTATNHKRKPVTLAVVSDDSLFHRIHALLYTVRVIARHEDELCTLLHASRSSDGYDEELNEEVRALLDAMPAHDYEDDLESLRAALPESATVRGAARTSGKTNSSGKAIAPAKPIRKAGTQPQTAKVGAKRAAVRKAIALQTTKAAANKVRTNRTAAKKTATRKAAVSKPARSRQPALRRATTSGKGERARRGYARG